MTIIEIKFKEKGQKVPWENLPVIRYVWVCELDTAIEWIKRMFHCVEIRWNHADSYQGHYIQGNISCYN